MCNVLLDVSIMKIIIFFCILKNVNEETKVTLLYVYNLVKLREEMISPGSFAECKQRTHFNRSIKLAYYVNV